MNAAVHTSTSPTERSSEHLANAAITNMLRCADSVVERLNALGISVVSVTVHGARPVIDVAFTAAVHKLTPENSGNWQSVMAMCPVRKRPFLQSFAFMNGCVVTWIKWG
jgi:hypothetical protein